MALSCSSSFGKPTAFSDWAPTPPMGWNSYDCFGAAVFEAEVLDNARMMEAHLKDFGWTYIVVDYCWYYPQVGALNNPPQSKDFKPSLPMDAWGRLLPAQDRFPSAEDGRGFSLLAGKIHDMGLKFGIHVMRGIPREAVARKMPIKNTSYTADEITDFSTCSWLNTMYGLDMDHPGAQAYYDSLFELYASWGVDFVKVDDIASPYREKEIEGYRKAIDRCGRPMVLSLSPGNQVPLDYTEHLCANANMWRVSADFWDDWDALKRQFNLLKQWAPKANPGHWPDADMIPFGILNRRGPDDGIERPSNFNDPEKVTLMTLWCIARSPLIYGGDLSHLRPRELELLTNRDVIEVNQHSKSNREYLSTGNYIIWTATSQDGKSDFVAVFNVSDVADFKVCLDLKEMGLVHHATVRDLWSGVIEPVTSDSFDVDLERHGARLFKFSK